MTVGELKKLLETVPDDLVVIIHTADLTKARVKKRARESDRPWEYFSVRTIDIRNREVVTVLVLD